jgi:hypothetical protein
MSFDERSGSGLGFSPTFFQFLLIIIIPPFYLLSPPLTEQHISASLVPGVSNPVLGWKLEQMNLQRQQLEDNSEAVQLITIAFRQSRLFYVN